MLDVFSRYMVAHRESATHHRRSPVGMDRELLAADPLSDARFAMNRSAS